MRSNPTNLSRASHRALLAKPGAWVDLGLTLPIFVAVASMQRFLVRGISMGAVKG